MTRLGAAIAALRGTRWAELRDVGEAQVALLRAELRRRTRPAGDLVQPVTSEEDLRFISAGERKAFARFSIAVDRAARYGVFRPQCLSSALALSSLLTARGFEAHRIRIGVRKDDTAFSAHAWVELDDGLRQNSGDTSSRFTTLTSVSLKRARSGSSGQNRQSGKASRRPSPAASS